MGLFSKKNSSNQSQGSYSGFNTSPILLPSTWHSEPISSPIPGFNGLVELANEAIGRDVAYVELEVDLPVFDGIKYFTGEAKRSPEDTQNDEIAINLAYARAFSAIAHKLNKRAAGLLKHQDDVIELKAKAKADRAAREKKAATAAKRRATIAAKLNSANR